MVPGSVHTNSVALRLFFTQDGLACHRDKGSARTDSSLTRTSMPKSYRGDRTYTGFLQPATNTAAEMGGQAVTEHLPLAVLHNHSHCWAPVLPTHGVILRPRVAPVLPRLADAK